MTLLGRIFHQGCERQTTLAKAAEGLGSGLLVGIFLTVVAFAFLGTPPPLVVFFMAAIIWAGGLLLSAPGWWVLHVLGARCQQAAMIYGGLVMFFAVFAGLTLLGASGRNSLMIALVFAAAGVGVGWVVGRVAYGKPAYE